MIMYILEKKYNRGVKDLNSKYVSWILGIMCFFLTIGVFIQIKTVKSSQTVVAKTITEAELRDNILRLQDKYNDKFEKLEKSTKELDQLIENLDKTDSNTNYSDDLKKLNNLLGYNTIEGQGIIITVQDGDSSTVKGFYSNYWVHDGDLLKIVNLLKSGGADAISINDERIVSSTAITCAGNIVKINDKKIGSPFVIKAIGLPEKLYGTVTVTDNYLKQMEIEGVKIDIVKKDKITDKIIIEKYNGIQSFNYARNIDRKE